MPMPMPVTGGVHIVIMVLAAGGGGVGGGRDGGCGAHEAHSSRMPNSLIGASAGGERGSGAGCPDTEAEAQATSRPSGPQSSSSSSSSSGRRVWLQRHRQERRARLTRLCCRRCDRLSPVSRRCRCSALSTSGRQVSVTRCQQGAARVSLAPLSCLLQPPFAFLPPPQSRGLILLLEPRCREPQSHQRRRRVQLPLVRFPRSCSSIRNIDSRCVRCSCGGGRSGRSCCGSRAADGGGGGQRQGGRHGEAARVPRGLQVQGEVRLRRGCVAVLGQRCMMR